jgi:hypothetical protein
VTVAPIAPQTVWALLIAAQAIVNLPVLFHLVAQWRNPMAISPAAQAIIDSLTAANTSLQTALSNAGGAAEAQLTEDLAGIKTAADALVASIDAATTPPAPAQ